MPRTRSISERVSPLAPFAVIAKAAARERGETNVFPPVYERRKKSVEKARLFSENSPEFPVRTDLSATSEAVRETAFSDRGFSRYSPPEHAPNSARESAAAVQANAFCFLFFIIFPPYSLSFPIFALSTLKDEKKAVLVAYFTIFFTFSKKSRKSAGQTLVFSVVFVIIIAEIFIGRKTNKKLCTKKILPKTF